MAYKMKIYNTLSKRKEEFVPLEEGKVKMYVCGPTVYNLIHIGNARPMIVFDTVRRYMEHKGYEVNYVSNFTDVDDKIIKKAIEEGVDASVISERYIAECKKDMAAMNVKPATTHPKATEEICGMLDMIGTLIEKGHAYVAEDGTVYFRTRSFKEYGKLSHKNLDDLQGGNRSLLVTGEDQKEDPLDFVLWKPKKEGEPYWESPWCNGRPGWHIECSVMSKKYLGDEIDIHAGGEDLVFPHHENEIAQSESLTGKKFANYWVHNGLIKINDQKMSKSLNNGILLEDLLNNYNFEVIRLLMLANKYSSDLNIIDGMFDVCEKKIYHFYKVLKMCKPLLQVYQPNIESAEYVNIVNQFKHAMDNDFNTAVAVANLYSWIDELEHNINKDNQKAVNMYGALVNVYKILNLLQQNPDDVINQIVDKHLKLNQITKQEIDELINQRTQYKLAKNYQLADGVRNSLADKHINIMDKNINGVATTLWDIDI